MPVVVSAIITAVAEGGAVESEQVPGSAVVPDLWEVWAQVTDPRDPRGRRHGLPSVLALVQAAVTSGATTFAAIAHWIKAASQDALAQCRVRVDRRSGTRRPPHPATMKRLLQALDSAEFDLAYARRRAAQMSRNLYDDDELIGMAVDGKAMCGTADGDTRPRHRMGALLHSDAIMVATLDVDGRRMRSTRSRRSWTRSAT
jgi:hypothetical protein